MSTPTRRVAVVGSGVSGLVAGWVLARDSHVTLYEADDRLGGHADTHDVQVGDRTVAVDTGFIVHNERTYPTLLRLFAELGIPTQESDMSMSVRDEETGLEWAGALGASGLFPTRANLANPRYLRMLTEIPRFHRMAKRVLATGVSTHSTTDLDETLEQFLERGRFTDFFVTYFMTPLVSAVWSTDPDHALDYPARYLFRFLEHHGMLTVFGSPTWRTVVGGSRCYVEKVAAGLDEVRVGRAVTGVVETDDAVWVTDAAGDTDAYDAVVLAGHPHQSLAMLTQPSAAQREVLGAMTYTTNHAQLHTDESVLPTRRAARASWNYWQRPDDDREPVLVTYDISRLMGIDEPDRRFLVTLGGEDRVDPATVIDTMTYEHPLYTPETLAAQRKLPSITTSRIAFAGAYHGWGFHEDGALSGVVAARHLGVEWANVADRDAAVAVAS
jgi:predicted NAD/FAD-binding protein